MKKLKENKSSLVIETIEDDTESLLNSLGITRERSEELQEITMKYWRQTDSITDSMNLISKHLLHANELFWVAYQVGTSKVESDLQHNGVAVKVPREVVEWLKDRRRNEEEDNS